MTSATVYTLANVDASANFLKQESAACESGFINNAVRPDSFAELTRQAILLEGANLVGYDRLEFLTEEL